MTIIRVKTQKGLDDAIAKHDKNADEIWVMGDAEVTVLGQATVRAWGQATVRAKKYVAIQLINGHTGKVTGGVVIKIPAIDTLKKWTDYYDADEKKGKLILYKALDKDLKSGHGMEYPIGKTITAPDWDNGQAECGGGLHFCATPWEALSYHDRATRYVACSVSIKEIRTPKKEDDCPNKVKARTCKVLYECDIDGKRISRF